MFVMVQTRLGEASKNKKWDAAIVVQGPYYPHITSFIFSQFLNRNQHNNILIVCATYRPDGEFLTKNEEHLLAMGQLVFIFVEQPSKDDHQFWSTNVGNQNLQRLTSFAGTQYVHECGVEYCLKIRSDSCLGKHNVIQFLLDELHRHPVRTQHSPPEMKGRLIVSGQGTISNANIWPAFHVRDHWYFGFTEDLMSFFNTTVTSTWRNGAGMGISRPEAALTCVWMKDLCIDAKNTEELLSRYFIVHDAVEVEQIRLTQTPYWSFDYLRYQREGKEYLRIIYATADYTAHVTTNEQWKLLL